MNHTTDTQVSTDRQRGDRADRARSHRLFGNRAVRLGSLGLLAATLVAGCGNGLETTASDGDSVVRSSVTDSASSPSTQDAPQTESTQAPAPASSTTAPSPSTAPRPSSPEPSRGNTPSAAAEETSSAPPADGGKEATSSQGQVCAASDLDVGTRRPEGSGAAGSHYLLLTFRNDSGTRCTLDGHPGVSFVGHGDGTQLGEPASRTPGKLPTVTLAPQDSTSALLKVSNAGNYDPQECAPTTADGLRVYPPDSTVSVYVPLNVQACQRSLDNGPQIAVSAVGDAS